MEQVSEQEGDAASSGGDAGIFEITDFTNASPWERYNIHPTTWIIPARWLTQPLHTHSFIADLEGLFRQWELARPDYEQVCTSTHFQYSTYVSISGEFS